MEANSSRSSVGVNLPKEVIAHLATQADAAQQLAPALAYMAQQSEDFVKLKDILDQLLSGNLVVKMTE